MAFAVPCTLIDTRILYECSCYYLRIQYIYIVYIYMCRYVRTYVFKPCRGLGRERERDNNIPSRGLISHAEKNHLTLSTMRREKAGNFDHFRKTLWIYLYLYITLHLDRHHNSVRQGVFIGNNGHPIGHFFYCIGVKQGYQRNTTNRSLLTTYHPNYHSVFVTNIGRLS